LCFRLLFQRADNLLAEVLGVGSHAGSLTQFSLYTQSETALGWIAAGWVMGAFTEEIIRAYLLYCIVELIGDTRAGWICAVLGSSLFYALNHQYQGFAGAVGVVVSCIGFGFLYLVSKRNLWSNIICHGINDTLALIAVFLGTVS